MVTAIALWLSVAGYAAWGWHQMKKHPPGFWRLVYYLLMLLLIHEAAAHGW